MNVSSLLRRMKRRLRYKKRWLSLGSWLLLLMTAVAFLWASGHTGHGRLHIMAPGAVETMQMKHTVDSYQAAYDPTANIFNELKKYSGPRETEVHKIFICGEEIEPLGSLSADEIRRLHQQHPQWEMELSQGGDVHFIESIHDLSTKCKQNAYFGLDKNGNFSLFEGLPSEDKVIRTFFQLDVKFLKTSLPNETVVQLMQGIRIVDLEEYNSVLSTFSTFAVDRQSAYLTI